MLYIAIIYRIHSNSSRSHFVPASIQRIIEGGSHLCYLAHTAKFFTSHAPFYMCTSNRSTTPSALFMHNIVWYSKLPMATQILATVTVQSSDHFSLLSHTFSVVCTLRLTESDLNWAIRKI